MPSSTANAAIHFLREGHTSARGRYYGRSAASSGFLHGLFRHANVDAFYCCAPSAEHFESFRQATREAATKKPICWIPYSKLSALAEAGCLYHPDPLIAELSWHRMSLGRTAFSFCGVTHTICSHSIVDGIGALLTAPVEAWDALVCTSRAARAVVGQIIESFGDYLASRVGTRPQPRLELPIIPLGVDCGSFVDTNAPAIRQALRAELNIGPMDVVALYVGRLSYHAKAHPLPMYAALEEVARNTTTKLHVVHFGWFANDALRQQFLDAAAQLCPTVTCHFLDGQQNLHRAVWHAADLLISLSDNLQETFGLAPIEAMAAGLPVVVSDWNGYRDTVRHGVDGFLIPTIAPPAGAGGELAARYELGIDKYDLYVGHVSQTVGVDLSACIQALRALVENPQLRQSMGEYARERARTTFDWSVVIAAYQELWTELAARRKRAAAEGRHDATEHPLRPDPYWLFAGYPSVTLDADCRLTLGPSAAGDRLQRLTALPMNHFAAHLLCSTDEQCLLIDSISRLGGAAVREIVESLPAERRPAAYRTLGWLAKLDAVRVADF